MRISERDAKIIHEYSIGLTTKEIACSNFMSIRAVESVLSRLKSAFECKTTVQLIATFLRNGTIK